MAIIVNNMMFNNGLKNREDSKDDEIKLIATFRKLRYDIWLGQNLSSRELQQLPSDIAKKDFSAYCIFIFVVMSHGAPDKIYGTDGLDVKILESIEHPFQSTNCPSFAGKPKLFFYQACRGSRAQQHQRAVSDDASSSSALVRSDSSSFGSNSDADFFSFYATTPQHKAWRTGSGSWFINELCQVCLTTFCHLRLPQPTQIHT